MTYKSTVLPHYGQFEVFARDISLAFARVRCYHTMHLANELRVLLWDASCKRLVNELPPNVPSQYASILRNQIF